MKTLMNNKIGNYQLILDKLNEKAIILNPLNLMSKGYSIVYQDGEVVTQVAELKINNDVDVRMADGKFTALVTSIERGEHGK
jgi:exodeoxyribonuclease VII large subunit